MNQNDIKQKEHFKAGDHDFGDSIVKLGSSVQLNLNILDLHGDAENDKAITRSVNGDVNTDSATYNHHAKKDDTKRPHKRSFEESFCSGAAETATALARKKQQKIANRYDERFKEFIDQFRQNVEQLDMIYDEKSDKIQDGLDRTLQKLGQKREELNNIEPEWYGPRRYRLEELWDDLDKDSSFTQSIGCL